MWLCFPIIGFSGRAVVSAGLGVNWRICRAARKAQGKPAKSGDSPKGAGPAPVTDRNDDLQGLPGQSLHKDPFGAQGLTAGMQKAQHRIGINLFGAQELPRSQTVP